MFFTIRSKLITSSLFIVRNMHHILFKYMFQDFLSKMKPSVHVTAAELTRWHPRFPLDSVPDIVPSLLPQPPVKSYQTARQLLETAGENLPSRVSGKLDRILIKKILSE